jgi:SAM-dependent methyltransferase
MAKLFAGFDSDRDRLTPTQKYAQPEVVAFWREFSTQGLQRCEQEMVRRYFPPSGRLLDLGCGSGRAVLALEQRGYQVTGLDLSLEMLAAGRSLSHRMALAGANLLDLPLADKSFDGLLMFFGALQHLPGRTARRRALAEMSRVARPGGRLILGLDNIAPSLVCYAYWLARSVQRVIDPDTLGKRLNVDGRGSNLKKEDESATSRDDPRPISSSADATLWNRETRRMNLLAWHGRGLVRTLRWRTWPGLVDVLRSILPTGPEPGDVQVAQFALPATPGRIFYHLYRPAELMEEAVTAGWRLLGYHSGAELNEGRVYPNRVRALDKQLFFAFETSKVTSSRRLHPKG